jgi:hypothetical protein
MMRSYRQKLPSNVEAMQWLPDDEEAAKELLWQLVKRHRQFEVRYSLPDDLPHLGVPIIVLAGKTHGAEETYIWPNDWFVREGPGIYTGWDDEFFLNEHEIKTDD